MRGRVLTAQGKQGKWETGKHMEFGNYPQKKHRENTGNLVFSSCKFPDLKVKDISTFDVNISNFFLGWISLPSQFCVCNSHKSRTLAQEKFAVGQGINRENTGNFKMQFEWVPWRGHLEI